MDTMTERMSLLQTSLLLVTAIVPTAVLTLPTFMVEHARQDGWLSVLVATFYGLLLATIYLPLLKRMGRTDLVTFSEQTLGKYLGKGIGLIVLLAYFILAVLIVREISALLLSAYFGKTPLWFMDAFNIVIATILVYLGLEVIARGNQFFFPFLLVFYLTGVVMLINEWELEFIRPVLYRGVDPVLEGTLPATLFFGEIFIILVLAPSIHHVSKAYKALIPAVLAIGVFVFLAVWTVLLLFGVELVQVLTFPFLSASRYVGGFTIMQNIDALVMAIWVIGGIFKITIFLYVITFLGAKVISLNNYNFVLFIMVPILFFVSHYYIDNYIHLVELIGLVTPYYFIIHVGIPLMLLFTSYFRGISFEDH